MKNNNQLLMFGSDSVANENSLFFSIPTEEAKRYELVEPCAPKSYVVDTATITATGANRRNTNLRADGQDLRWIEQRGSEDFNCCAGNPDGSHSHYCGEIY